MSIRIANVGSWLCKVMSACLCNFALCAKEKNSPHSPTDIGWWKNINITSIQCDFLDCYYFFPPGLEHDRDIVGTSSAHPAHTQPFCLSIALDWHRGNGMYPTISPLTDFPLFHQFCSIRRSRLILNGNHNPKTTVLYPGFIPRPLSI